LFKSSFEFTALRGKKEKEKEKKEENI